MPDNRPEPNEPPREEPTLIAASKKVGWGCAGAVAGCLLGGSIGALVGYGLAQWLWPRSTEPDATVRLVADFLHSIGQIIIIVFCMFGGAGIGLHLGGEIAIELFGRRRLKLPTYEPRTDGRAAENTPREQP